MSYVLAFLGFIALIILHEAGHFVAAKATGMRVERFSLFFPPTIAKFRRGETEYALGATPLGGYVKITGMNPNEEIPDDVRPRAYYNQAVWKRIVTIAAGPAVNILIAFAIVWGLIAANGELASQTINTRVAAVDRGSPAAHVLRPGDRIVSVDGVPVEDDYARVERTVNRHRCAGAQVNGCVAATPVKLVVKRNGTLQDVSVRPKYDASPQIKRMLIGFEFGSTNHYIHPGVAGSAGHSVSYLWWVSKKTVSTFARLFEPKERRQVTGVVGAYAATQESFAASGTKALTILALISLSLGVINLFPFLPLDGGHIFWALAEKVRGRRIPFSVMERSGIVGFALILIVFVIGMSNSISTLANGGYGIH
jgi:regulator of sigma E protease